MEDGVLELFDLYFMSPPVDVLNLEWTSAPSRDRQMATLVCNYLRFMGYKVMEASVFNGYSLLTMTKPKVLFITNTVGAPENYKLMKYAKHKGVIGVSLISEGNFVNDKQFIEEFVWGWNKEKILYEDIHLQWTERTRELTISYYPKLKNKIKVSGGVGFDVYKIARSQEKKVFLRKYNKEVYTKVIGVGCWDFGILYPGDHRYVIWKNIYSNEIIERFRQDQRNFNKILRDIINKNSDKLFLLKEHPGCIGGRKASGIEGLEQFPNVLILKNEESIIDCISISDFWIVYESTTAMEAWLLGKQTCLLNPSGTDFPRDSLFQGSPNYPTVEILQRAIDTFYISGILPGFAELEDKRKKIIKDTIQWDDGLNHVRAGNEIINLLENYQPVNLKKDNPVQLINRYEQKIKWTLSPYLSFLPKFRFYAQQRRNFDEKQLLEFQKKRMEEQIAFYKKNNLDKEDLRQIRCI